MNCKGCVHCQYVSKDGSLGIVRPFHYCDIWNDKESIGESYKWCEGRDYENKETENFRNYLKR